MQCVLFADDYAQKQASAILYSLVETASADGITPFDHLRNLLEEIPKQPENIDHLLPWDINIGQ